MIEDDYLSRIVRYLNAYNGYSQGEETLRILKIGEEFGEAAEAWIGYLGQNPRKGVTHSREDVIGELADVAVTALVAIESLGADASGELANKLRSIVDRLRLSPEVRP